MQYLRPMYRAAGITGGLCLLFALFGSGLMSFSSPTDATYRNYPQLVEALRADRQHLLSADAWRSFFFIAAAFGGLWFYIKKSLHTTLLLILMGILILLDLWMVQYSERVYNIRTEIIESVLETIKDICRQTKGRSILWDSLTNHLNTDICYEKDSGPSSVLPDTIGLTDDDKGFYITFASYCDAPSSNDGENIYTETLIDILEYLENYRSTL